MVISLKDGFKLFGIFIMSCCAVTVCISESRSRKNTQSKHPESARNFEVGISQRF